MAELPSDEENELNFSDYDAESDDDAPRPPTTSVIAHKEMKTVQISDPEDSDKEDSDREDSDKEEINQELEFESISPPAGHSDDRDEKNEKDKSNDEQKISSTVISGHESEQQTFEPISPVSDHGNFETISPPASPPPDSKPQFENISDDEDEADNKKTDELPEGKFSPVEDENELNFNVDESSNDSGYHIIQKPQVEESEKTEDKTNDKTKENVEPPEEHEEEIEAPMPSPFSDIGDLDDITESDGQIISDILKDTDATEQQFEFKNEMFGGKTVPSEKELDGDQEKAEIEEGKTDASNEKDESEEGKDHVGVEDDDDSSKKEKEKGDGKDDDQEPKVSFEKADDKEEETEEKDAGEKEDKDEEKGVDTINKNESMDIGDGGSEKEEETNKVEKLADIDSDAEKEKKDGEEKKDEDENSGEIEKEKEGEKKDEEEDEGEDAGDLIADIFGESDEEEEFEGFADEEMPEGEEDKAESDVDEDEEALPAIKTRATAVEEKRDDSSDDEPRMPARDFVNDFDLMLEKKKAEKRIKRRRKDVDIISDNDEIIANMIRQMKEAADEDRMLNQSGKAATKKLKMLQHVIKSLRKSDLQGTFIDCGVLGGIKEWLTPLPDHALPHIHIRKLMLQVLSEFPPLEKSTLKSSGIGRAVMLLFKHPKETRENKYMAGKIISNWARPIFNVSTNFMDMSKEEREERDKRLILQNKRKEESEQPSEPKRNKLDKDDDDMENRPRRPGDPGWCVRARVPQASNRDYVNRPVSKVDAFESSRQLNTKKPLNRYEKHALKLKAKRGNKAKAMDISLSGSKMGL